MTALRNPRSSLIVHRKKQNTLHTNSEKRTTNKRGFTLIELMITITIIAIISAVGFASYSKAQQLGRDAKRKQDLRSISIALEIYKQKNGRYPCQNTPVSSGSTQSFWISDSDYVNCPPAATSAKPLDINYISAMPIDPLRNDASFVNGDTAGLYGYTYSTSLSCVSPYPTSAGQFYILRTRLENASDPDSCRFKQNKNCDNLVVCRAGAEVKNDLFIITSQ